MSDARRDLGYEATAERRSRPDPSAAPASAQRCAVCADASVVLHHDPRNRDPRRTICGRCQGRINAGRKP